MRYTLLIPFCLLLITGNAQPVKTKNNATAPPVSSTQIRGLVNGRPGSTIVLQLNNANDITIKLVPGANRFTFTKPLPDGSAYQVTVKSQPPGESYTVKTYAGAPNVVSPESFVTIYGDLKYDLVTRDSSNHTGTFFESWDPVAVKSLEDDARYVVFVSQAQGLCGSSGKYRQIFWRDRLTGVTKMISRSPNGEEGNGNSFVPVISVGSIYVAFESYASNLVTNDGNGVRDVFLWRRTQAGDGELQRVSESAAGAEGNSQSFEPCISGMGGQVAYSSNATNLLDDGTEVSGVNVYLWDKSSKKTTLLSKDPKTGKGVGGSKPSIDMNGYRVAFWSWAYTLVPDDKNNLWDIFLYERNSGLVGQPLRRITMAYDGSERNQGDESSSRVVTPYISGDGHFISYATTASNVVPDDNNKMQDAFVYDIENNTTTRISVNNNGEEGNGNSPSGQGERIELSYNGSIAAFTTMASNFGMPANNIAVYNLPAKKIIPVTNVTGTYVSTPSLSRSGRYVVFGCGQPLDSRFSSSGLFAAYIATLF